MNSVFLVCGKIGSGKTTVSGLLSLKLGARIVAFSDVVRQFAELRESAIDREYLQTLGETLVEINLELFCEKAINYAKASSDEMIVFDGLRHESVLELMRTKLSPRRLICLYVETDEETRISRIRKKYGITLKELRRLEEHSTEQQVEDLLRAKSDIIVVNTHSAEEAVEQTLHWIKANIM